MIVVIGGMWRELKPSKSIKANVEWSGARDEHDESWTRKKGNKTQRKKKLETWKFNEVERNKGKNENSRMSGKFKLFVISTTNYVEQTQ